MAIRGRKPTPPALRLINGGKGRPPPEDDPLPSGSLERPTKLRGAAGKLWDDFIAKCFWLTWADSPKAAMWCHLQAEFDSSPKKMIASRIAQLRTLGSELGFDQASRTRMGIKNPDPKPEPADKYLT
jgi:hypothetical protein